MELIAFKSKQVKEILELIGEDITNETFGTCETCKEILTLENIGFIARGDNKNLLFCDNTACFSPMVAKKFPNRELCECGHKLINHSNNRDQNFCVVKGCKCEKFQLLEQDAPSDEQEIKKELHKDYEM